MSEEWARVELNDGVYHILPTFDVRQHETDDCWCIPDIRHFEDGNTLISHYAESDCNEITDRGH